MLSAISASCDYNVLILLDCENLRKSADPNFGTSGSLKESTKATNCASAASLLRRRTITHIDTQWARRLTFEATGCGPVAVRALRSKAWRTGLIRLRHIITMCACECLRFLSFHVLYSGLTNARQTSCWVVQLSDQFNCNAQMKRDKSV